MIAITPEDAGEDQYRRVTLEHKAAPMIRRRRMIVKWIDDALSSFAIFSRRDKYPRVFSALNQTG